MTKGECRERCEEAASAAALKKQKINEVLRLLDMTPEQARAAEIVNRMRAMTADRKTRDVLRVLDPEIDRLLIRTRYFETSDAIWGGVCEQLCERAERKLEKLVGTEMAKSFIQDEIDDAEKRARARAVRRAVLAQQQEREGGAA